jgi:hypothetical protein
MEVRTSVIRTGRALLPLEGMSILNNICFRAPFVFGRHLPNMRKASAFNMPHL